MSATAISHAVVTAPHQRQSRVAAQSAPVIKTTMSQDPRPPKRPRDMISTCEASKDSVDSLKRSKEFWIEDGNIVLVAGETAFRVYRGLLALQSTIFADLFASSSPSAEERYDDCPVIRLTDSPQDLTHLLRALLPTSRASYV